ncbi:MAG TPA: dTDP-4-dehydrorhamnose 3,5-epimerase [Polyangiaceae bacterium]|nr:dTDP-4-dehydrorhamnose 3,5-epimerase [Polyangiaceae bacterium]
MRFEQARLPGAYVVELEPRADERGFFARCFCEHEFAAHGLPVRFPQCNLSRNRRAGTLRGMHYQAAPHREAKLVRVTAGSVYDVIVDLRPASPTHLQWLGVELSADTGRALYVPEGFAHGFVTLEDDTDVFYHMSESYRAEGARGIRWDDPRVGIRWPRAPAVIAPRDATYPDFDPTAFDG